MTMDLIELNLSTREHVVLMRRPHKEVSLSDRGICQKVL